MDLKRYYVRPFEEGDYEFLNGLQTERLPEIPSTAQDEREWDDLLEHEHMCHEKWTVVERESGDAVAVAALGHAVYAYDPLKFWASVLVSHRHVDRGIGSALASLLDAEAVEHRAVSYWTNVRKDDPRSLRFAQQRGFEQLRTTWLNVLDLSDPARIPVVDRSQQLEREGFRLTTLAEEGPTRPEVRRRIYDLWVETSRDVPRMGKFIQISYSQFEAEVGRSAVIPEAFFLAGHGETYVATTYLERNLAESDSLMIGYTGTLSAFRGRGLATELKRRAIEYARERGIRYLKTFNDARNGPIGAINEKMGFRRTVELANLERRFGPKPPPPSTAAPR